MKELAKRKAEERWSSAVKQAAKDAEELARQTKNTWKKLIPTLRKSAKSEVPHTIRRLFSPLGDDR